MADSLPPGMTPEDDVTEQEHVSPDQAETGGTKPNVKRIISMAVIALIACAAIWKGAEWWTDGRFQERTDNAYIRADITLVAPRVQGYIEAMAVEDNQRVKAGDLLFVIESADYNTRLHEAQASVDQSEAAVRQAEAKLSAQQALLETAEAQLTSQKSNVQESLAAVEVAKARADQAENHYSRYAELSEEGFFPKARLDDAATNVKTAKAELERARAAYTTQKSQLALAQASIDRARQELVASEAAITGASSQVAAAKARLDSAALDVSRTEVRAPVSGVIANRSVQQGQLVSPGQQAMAIVPVDQSYVIANFKETQVGRMKPGQTVEIRIDAYPDLHATGVVQSLSPASGAQFSLIPQDTATGNFTKIVQRVPVRIKLSDEVLASGLMRPGLSVEAVVNVKAS